MISKYTMDPFDASWHALQHWMCKAISMEIDFGDWPRSSKTDIKLHHESSLYHSKTLPKLKNIFYSL